MNGRRKKGGKNKENENGDEWALFPVAQQVIMANKYTLFFYWSFKKGRVGLSSACYLKKFPVEVAKKIQKICQLSVMF
jgi:hypothetical protein